MHRVTYMGQTISRCFSGLTLPFLQTYTRHVTPNYFIGVVKNTMSNFGTLEYWITNPTNSNEVIMVLHTAAHGNTRIQIPKRYLRMMIYNTKTSKISPVPINDGFVFDHITHANIQKQQ